MADEMGFVPAFSRTPSLEAGGPQIVPSTMPASLNADGGKLPPPGEVKETAFSSPSATYTSATMQNRTRNGGIPTRLHLRGLLRVKVGAGIVRDIRARAPWYWSDWKDAWNYRVLPATALVFFAK
jgi:HCO3- transporter family